MSGGYQYKGRGNYDNRGRDHQSGGSGEYGLVTHNPQFYQLQPPPAGVSMPYPFTACQGQGFNPPLPAMNPGIAAGVGRGILHYLPGPPQRFYTNPSIPGAAHEQCSTSTRPDTSETDKGASRSGDRSRSHSNEGNRHRSSSNHGDRSRSHSNDGDSHRTERREPRAESGSYQKNFSDQAQNWHNKGGNKAWSWGRGRNQNNQRQQNHWQGNNQGQYQDYYHGPPQSNYHDNHYYQQNYNQNSGLDYSGRQQNRPSRREQDDLVFLSRTLSSILRHNAEKFGLKLMKGGFIYVDDILKNVKKLWGFDLDNIKWVVDNNDKKRFTLEREQEGGKWKIRANQGHTVEVDDLDLKPITQADEFPHVIHGTYYSSWEMIKETGLCRMNRNHIHFAAGEPGHDGVISGMRSSCEVMIYIDLEKALKDGLKFFVSSNNVILCPGNEDGYLFPCYFRGALDKRQKYRLPFDDKICSLKLLANSEAGTSKNKKKKKGKKNRQEFDDTQHRNPKDKQRERSTEQEEFEVTDIWNEPEEVKDTSTSKPQSQATVDSKIQTQAPADSKPQTRAPADSKPQTQAPADSKPQTQAPADSKPQTQAPVDKMQAKRPHVAEKKKEEPQHKKEYRLPFDDKICSLKLLANSEAGTSKNKKKKKGKKNRQEFDDTQHRNPKDKQRERSTEQEEFEVTDIWNEPEEVKDTSTSKPQSQATVDSKIQTQAPADSKPQTRAPADSKPQTQAPADSKPQTQAPADSKPQTQAPVDKMQAKRPHVAEKKKEEPQHKKEGPEWQESPTVIADNETSASAVDHILTELSPSSIVICCCGRGLGTENSDLAVMVVMAQPEIYVYHLQGDQKSLVADGRLIDLLLSKEIKKVFHNIGSVSPSLIHEFDILLNGVPICDIALMWGKCSPSAIEIEALEEKFDVPLPEMKKGMKSWEIENEILAEKLEDKDNAQEVVDKLIQRGKLIAELYRICLNHINPDLERSLKKEVFDKAIPNEGHLKEKIEQLKKAAKGKDKKETGKETEQASANQQQQQQNKPKQQQKQQQNKHKQSPKKNKNKNRK